MFYIFIVYIYWGIGGRWGGGGGSKRVIELIKIIGVNYCWLLLFNENVIFVNICIYNVGRLFVFYII